MFLTIKHRPLKSVTGTDAADGVVADDALLPKPAVPMVPRQPVVSLSDQRIGIYGGLLYNCAPRDVVGSIVFALPSPYREVTRADASELGPVLGVLVNKPAPTICEVVHAGAAPVFRDLVPGTRYFLGAKGTLVAAPLHDLGLNYIHFVGYALSTDTLMVQPSYGLLKVAAT